MESRWTIGAAQSHLFAGGDTDKKHAGFPGKTSPNLIKLELPSPSEGRRKQRRLCGMSVPHPLPAQQLLLLEDDRTEHLLA